MNRRAKYDAASFILGGEIRNRTNTHTNTHKQTVTDISTPCLSACVDKNTVQELDLIKNTTWHNGLLMLFTSGHWELIVVASYEIFLGVVRP